MLAGLVVVTVGALLVLWLAPRVWALVLQARAVSHFPRPTYSLLTGTSHHFPHGPAALERQLELMRGSPRAIHGFAGPVFPVLVLWHHETVAELLLKSRNDPKSGLIYDPLLPWLGRGLLTANGAHWAKARRMLTPAFHFNILTRYANEIFVDAAAELCDKWRAQIAAAGGPTTAVELFHDMSRLSLDIMLRSAFSYTSQCQGEHDNPYIQAVYGLSEAISKRMRGPVLPKLSTTVYHRTAAGRRYLELCDYVHRYSEELISERRQVLLDLDPAHGGPHGVPAAPHNRKLDFVDILLTAKDEQGRGLSLVEIREQVDTFLFEGHDTTSSGASWTLYLLAKHPEVQRKAQEEVDRVIGRATPTQAAVGNLKYLNVVIKEALRLYPPVPGYFRNLGEDMTVDGVTVPAGTPVGVNTYCLHRNPEVWGKDAEEFRPERWEKPPVHPTAYVPFSAGSRNCIGQNFASLELRVVAATVLQHFDLSIIEGQPEPQPLTQLILRSANGIHVNVSERKHE